MKYKIVAFWGIVFCALFAFLQTYFQFHFYYIEQSQLFQYSGGYWMQRMAEPGGLALWLSEWLVQFFMVPYAGPAITAGLLTLAGFITGRIIRRIAPLSEWYLLPLLPVVMLMLVSFDFNYRVFGTVAFCLMAFALWGYLSVGNTLYRLITGGVLALLLFVVAGPVALLFAVSVSVYELLSHTPKGYWTLLTCAGVLLAGICSVYFSMLGEYRFAFLPDGYYHRSLEPKTVIYYSWICFLLVFVVAFLIRRRKNRPGMKRGIGEGVLQLLLLGGLLYWGIPQYSDRKSAKLKELDYYTRMEQWDKVVDACQGKVTNFLYLCYLNKALAERGELADRMFAFDQRGPQGLLVSWNKAEQVSALLSEVYFTIGYMGPAQEMAFEGYVSTIGYGNPRLLKRLVQTNLIYGFYPVAEKYMDVLENTFYYKDWASAQRKFLNNDTAVEADPVLGPRRKALPEDSNLAQANGFNADLQLLAKTNPANKAPIEYLGAFFLLTKDMDGFRELIETYYGTEVLPVLPVSFQEAVITLSEKEPEYRERFQISESILRRFADYKKTVLANKNNPSALPGLLYRSFGNTYWFYFMFK